MCAPCVREEAEKGFNVKKLTYRQQLFVEEYLCDLNGTQAAVRAGYARKGAEATASKLLTNPKVALAVAESYQQKLSVVEVEAQDAVMTRHEQMVRDTAIARANLFDFFEGLPGSVTFKDFNELSEEQQQLADHVELDHKTGTVTKVKLTSRNPALDRISKTMPTQKKMLEYFLHWTELHAQKSGISQIDELTLILREAIVGLS